MDFGKRQSDVITSCPLTLPELTVDLVKGSRRGAERDGGYAHGMACECTLLVTAWNKRIGVISGFRRGVSETRVLLGYYAAYSGNSLPTFRDNLSVPTSSVRNPRILYPFPTDDGILGSI